MCYFLYVGVKQYLTNHLINLKTNDIAIDFVNEYLGIDTMGYNYYLIHRQCSCDFIRKLDNNKNEIMELFDTIKDDFQIIIIFESGSDQDDNTHQLSRVLLNTTTIKIDHTTLLSQYPNKLHNNVVYEIVV